MSEEGNETQNEQQVPGEHLGHREHQLVFALILFVLLGTALFFGAIFTTPAGIDKISTQKHVVPNEEMTAANFVDVPGRDKEVLGLAIHKEKGRHYSHPDTSMTLYINTGEGCDARCEEYFMPYITDDEVHQKIPQGDSLYLHKNDAFPGDTNGDGFDGLWEIARP